MESIEEFFKNRISLNMEKYILMIILIMIFLQCVIYLYVRVKYITVVDLSTLTEVIV